MRDRAGRRGFLRRIVARVVCAAAGASPAPVAVESAAPGAPFAAAERSSSRRARSSAFAAETPFTPPATRAEKAGAAPSRGEADSVAPERSSRLRRRFFPSPRSAGAAASVGGEAAPSAASWPAPAAEKLTPGCVASRALSASVASKFGVAPSSETGSRPDLGAVEAPPAARLRVIRPRALISLAAPCFSARRRSPRPHRAGSLRRGPIRPRADRRRRAEPWRNCVPARA